MSRSAARRSSSPGVAGCAAVLSRDGASIVDVVPTVIGTVCGVAVLRLLTSGRWTDEPAAEADEPDVPDHGRRLSLLTLGLFAGGALTGCARRRADAGTIVGRRGPRRVRPAEGRRRRAAGSADGAAQRCCAAVVHHQQRRLLPDRHRAERAAAQPRRLGAEDPRHGGPRDHLPLRGSGAVRGDREGRDAGMCLQPRWRRPHLERDLDRATGCATCWPTRAYTPTPTWCCRSPATGSPRARPSKRSPTTGTRCSPSG